MTAWIWIETRAAVAVHDMQLAEHGGATGLRDLGLLESAVMRPKNLAAYADPDVAALAAAYAFGVARNHPFVDGNKRTSLVLLELFLELNGYSLTAEDEACVLMILALADGSLSEDELANWVRANIVRN